MTDAAPPPVTESADSAPVTDEAPPAIDHKAAVNAALKAANVRLKAKDREYVPRDIDDLTNKANRVFGLESELESFKSEKAEAAKTKAWRAAIEADDDNAAEQAFDSLSPRAQQNAAKWLQRKYAAHEAERQLPPEALEAKRRADALEQENRGYKQREEEGRQQVERQENAKLMRETHESTLKTATSVMAALKVDAAKAPRAPAALLPVVARHMRVAMLAEVETGVPPDAAELAANVQRDVVESFGAVMEGMGDDVLYEAIGEATVKRLLKAHLVRVKGVKPSPSAAAKQAAKGDAKRDPAFGTPGYFR